MMKKLIMKSLIEAFVLVCSKRDFESITVKELCELCGISKPTFYKYFKDKYDAAAQIYLYDAGLMDQNAVYFSVETTREKLLNIHDHRVLYLKAFEAKGQNSLYNFLADHTIELLVEHSARSLHHQLSDEEMYILSCYAYGWIHGIEDWLKGKTHYTVEQLASYQQRNVPDFLRRR